MTLDNIKKWGKSLIDHQDIRNKTEDIQLIMSIVGYDLLGVSEFANDFDFKHDLWFLVSRDKLTEETFNESIDYFNDKYDNICSYLQRFKFEEIKDILITITNINEKNGLHAETYKQGFSKWVKGFSMKQIKMI